jgi:hypothetical protein
MTKKELTTLEDPANKAFLALIEEDNSRHLKTVAVDSGQIAIGDCETIQFKVDTATGDGLYPVWQGEKYIIIEKDMLNSMKLDKELEAKWVESMKELEEVKQ